MKRRRDPHLTILFLNVFLQCFCNAVGPGIDATVHFKGRYELYNGLKGHAIAQDSTYELGIVPILRVKFFGEPFNSGLIPYAVFKLEVVTLGAVFVYVTYYLASID